jgi:predicted nucleic acid-binding protein
MILCDVNVLLYAMREDSPHHAAALAWLQSTLGGEDAFGWHPLLGASVVRIATNRRIFAEPSPLERTPDPGPTRMVGSKQRIVCGSAA